MSLFFLAPNAAVATAPEPRLGDWFAIASGLSYALLLVVILLSYFFYVFGWKDSSFSEMATRAQSAVRNAGRRATTQLLSGASRAVSGVSSALLSESSESAPAPSLNLGLGRTNTGRANAGILE
jgi:hypothetical protein